MTAISWQNAVSGNWNDATLWSTGTVPGSGDGAFISVNGSYTISISASIDVGTVALSDADATLAIFSPGQTDTVDGDFINSGTLDVDTGFEEGGSALTIDGTLTNESGAVISLGNSYATAPSALDVSGVAPGALEGNWTLTGDVSITFGSGQITAIAGNGNLLLDGPVGFIADAGTPGSDSAVALSSNAGILELESGAALTTTGNLDNTGTINVDEFSSGGSTLTIDGTLTNEGSATVNIGSPYYTPTAPSALDVAGMAPSVLEGAWTLTGDVSITFGSGQITAIAGNGDLLLDGPVGFIADAGTPGSDSAVALSSNAGILELESGAALTTTGNLDNTGTINVDEFSSGGSTLTIDGTLTNEGSATVNIGSPYYTPTAPSVLDVTGMAPSVLEGAWTLSGEASITFGSGQITAIAGNGDLLLDGPVGFIADAGTPGSDSAVALSGNAGVLELRNGATLTTTGNLDNTGTINVDEFSSGGSTLTIDGTLTNEGSATVNIGSPYYTPAAPSALDVTGMAPSVLEGAWTLSGEASITFGSGQITAIAGNGDLLLDGPVGFIADAGSPGSDSAVALSDNAGVLELRNGATLTTTGNLDNTGTINVDEFSSGGSTLTVDGTLTNEGSATVNIGSPYYTPTAPSVLDVTGMAPSVLEGAWTLSGEASITFGSGQITAIAGNGDLLLDGPVGFIADAGTPGSDSAVALSGNAGVLELRNGATLTTTGNLDNTGTINVDEFSSGGSTLTIDGTLTNEGSATVNIGSPYYTPAAPSALDVTGMAPSVLEGAWTLSGEASITFGSGQITAIAGNGDLLLDGPVGFIADAGSPGSDSAVALSDNAGVLELRNGATLTTTGNLDNTGTINVDEFSSGGSTLTVDGTLTNEGSATVNIGSPYYTPTAPSVLDVTGMAPSVLEGAWTLSGEASITFGSGQITAIAGNGDLLLDGPVGFIADAGTPGSDSAVALSGNAGVLELRNGATLTTTGNLDNTGTINVDEFSSGGSTLTIDGTLTNEGSATVNIGSPYYTPAAPSALDVTGAIDDAGSLTLAGEAVLIAGSLNVDSGNSVTGAGQINAGIINNDGTITASGGSLTIDGPISGSGALAIAGGATLVLGNSDAEAVSFGGNVGTLKLDVPSRFSGEIQGLMAGDTLDLAGLTATNAAIVGSSLVITTAEGQSLTYQISGTLVGSGFQIQSDGNGGSDLVLTSQASQSQPYDNFYTAVDALATDISDGAPGGQITTDAVNVYTTAIAGAIGTIGNAAWQQAYTTSSIAAAAVGNDLADGQPGSKLLADTLSLYNTIIAGGAGLIAGGVSQDDYTSILQAAGTLSTDILNGASSSQLQGDLASLYNALASATPNATNPSGWETAQNASNQALATLSTDIGNGANAEQILSDASSLYDAILSGSLGAIGGTTLQVAYAEGTQTLAGLGSDIVNEVSSGNLQGDVEGAYNSIVSAASSATSATVIENYGSVTASAETLLSQLGTSGTSSLYNDVSSLFSTVVSTQPLTLSVLEDIETAIGSSILNISSIETSLQPPSIDSTDWGLIADRLSAQVGDTTQSLLTALSQAATTLAQIGETTTDVATLLDYELEQASGTLPNITLADSTDLSPSYSPHSRDSLAGMVQTAGIA